MPSERWIQVERLYHSALEQPADSRHDFLAAACGGDQALRQEVESLLAEGDSSDDFLETPAVHVAARQSACDVARWNIAGKTVSHYRVIEEIGAGGMGVVYLARDETLNRRVAIKVLPHGSLADATARRRLRKEALALAKLSHPNIETIYELGSHEGVDFLVTEFVAGTTLADRVATGPLPEPELVEIAIQIASALEEAAGNGLVHLDLKPRNMMLTPKGQVKLLDFGLARMVKPNEGDGTHSLTAVAAPAGTPPYMAPEQLLGGPLDVRTDIYAVGASLYELAAGRAPFRGNTLPELIAAILHTPADPPANVRPGLSPGLEKVILKCLDKAPERRYQTVAELLADLHALQADQSSTARFPLRRRWFVPRATVWLRPWKLGVLFVCLGVAIAAMWWLRSRPLLPFAARDWVLVADFDNQTNDPIFDQSLLTAFSISLGQSRYANIYPQARIRQVLARMKKGAGTRIDETVAHEIAVREGIRALILPSVSGVGDDYRLASRIRDVSSGIDVKTAIVKAKGKNQILDSVDRLAGQVREDLGESMPAISHNNRPLPAVTTASLDALKQFAKGTEIRTQGFDLEEAKHYFENALKIDPAFTAAQTSLGILNFEHFDRVEGKRLIAEAVRNADKLPDPEKYTLLAFHARAVEGNLEKAAAYDRVLIGLYPDSSSAHNGLGIVYSEMRRYPEAVKEYQECLRIDPRDRLAFVNLAKTYLTEGDLDQSIEACDKQIAKNEKFWLAYCLSGYAYLAKGQVGDAVKNLEQGVELEPKSAMCGFDLALAYSMSGQPQNAVKVLNQLLATDAQDCDAHYYLGIVYDSIGDRPAAVRAWRRSVGCQQEALKLRSSEAADYLEIALARARLGDPGGAQDAEDKAHSIDPKLYFDTARLRSVQGRTEEALGLLESAEKNGLSNFAWVKLNPDLRSLSTQPRFVALLQRNLKGLPPQ